MQFAKLLLDNADLFAQTVDEIGETKLIEHDIELFDETPINQRNYRHSPEVRDIIDSEVQKLLKAGVVQSMELKYSCY